MKKFFKKVRNVAAFVVLGVVGLIYFALLALMAGIEYIIVCVSLPFRFAKRALLALGRGIIIGGAKKVAKIPGMNIKTVDEETHEQVS